MKNKSLSALGYIMDCMGISTSSLSNTLHVDASLVSKWKNGSRILSSNSCYYDDIIQFILDISNTKNDIRLKNTLLDLYPQESIENNADLEHALHKALSNRTPIHNPTQNHFQNEHSTSISVLMYENTCGRREAVTKMLDYAEEMTTPGEFTFIDNEQFSWLIDDISFSTEFTHRMVNLIKKGFHATFVLYYSSNNSRLNKLFNQCSPLIFHRNISWYYKEYYDESLLNYSLFILNKAISVLGLSVEKMTSSTMIFTEASLVLKHELMARQIIGQCKQFFTYFDMFEMNKVISSVSKYRKKGVLYSFLPSPVFMCSDDNLLSDILNANDVDKKTREKCMLISHQIQHLISPSGSENNSIENPSLYIFQVEELLKRADKKEFTSRSLSLLCGQDIKISAAQYVTELKKIIANLTSCDNVNVILVSQDDHMYLPNVNCWCKQNIWMVQMTKDGLRISDEYSLVNAALNMFEQYYRMVPSERKNKSSVCQFINELIEYIENRETCKRELA